MDTHENLLNEILISDNEQSIIDRNEINKKLERLSVYLRVVNTRIKQLHEQNEGFKSNKDAQLIKRGLQLLKLKKNINREI